jgi:hypothetical protein
VVKPGKRRRIWYIIDPMTLVCTGSEARELDSFDDPGDHVVKAEAQLGVLLSAKPLRCRNRRAGSEPGTIKGIKL